MCQALQAPVAAVTGILWLHIDIISPQIYSRSRRKKKEIENGELRLTHIAVKVFDCAKFMPLNANALISSRSQLGCLTAQTLHLPFSIYHLAFTI